MNELQLNDSWENLISLFIANLDRKENTKLSYRKALKEWCKFFENEQKDANVHLILQ